MSNVKTLTLIKKQLTGKNANAVLNAIAEDSGCIDMQICKIKVGKISGDMLEISFTFDVDGIATVGNAVIEIYDNAYRLEF
jgi:hypothetical protein